MVNYIYLNGDGHKVARPVTNREDYVALRNAAENAKNFYDARGGDEKAKALQVQFNYNDLLPDGVVKGCRHPSSTFAHDIDCGNAEEQAIIRDELLKKKDEIGLLELSGSARWGLHAVCRRQPHKSVRECQYALSMATHTEYDTNARGLARVMFTGPATDDNLFYLDDAIFDEPLTVAESEAEYLLLKEREQRGEEEVPPEAKKANKHYRPWEDSESKEIRSQGEVLDEKKSSSLEYNGIPYEDIIRKWWELYNEGREPKKNNRDVLTFELAVNLRHICGFDRELMASVIPCYDGFPVEQKMKCIDSALAERRTMMPKRLKDVLQELRRENYAGDDSQLSTLNSQLQNERSAHARNTHSQKSPSDTAA